MAKISMFGISGSGKTCYLYAMAQVLQGGARQDNFRLSMIANDIQQQTILHNGYLMMAADGRWPKGSDTTTGFDLRVRVQYDGEFSNIIENLTLLDYAGGVWTNNSLDADKDRINLMNEFMDSSAVLFLVDGKTLLQAMDANDLHPSHRDIATIQEIVMARQQISFVENLFLGYKQHIGSVPPQDGQHLDYRQHIGSVPPVMVVVTKADVFMYSDELEKGKNLIKEYLPSLFAKGSGIYVGITAVSLGTNLSAGEDNRIQGHLSLSTQYNIHLPIIYGLYAYLSEVYDGSPEDEKAEIERVVVPLRAMMKDKVEMFSNGSPLISL